MMRLSSRQSLALCSRLSRVAGDSLDIVRPTATSSACSARVTGADKKFQWKNSHSVSGRQESMRWKSSLASEESESELETSGPMGPLFQFPEVGPDLVGMTGSIKRSFGPQSNAQAMLTCGGEALAAHASFDPNYSRARDWIRSHPVGPAKLSPVLISGLVGALVEAAFPQAIAISSSIQSERPLIVGVDVRAKIEVVKVTEKKPENFDGKSTELAMSPDQQQDNDVRKRKHGYQVDLSTAVVRVRDDMLIAKGTQSVWIPDYLHM